jgi:hypothetical protein
MLLIMFELRERISNASDEVDVLSEETLEVA